MDTIPFVRPYHPPGTEAVLKDVLLSRRLAGNGPWGRRVETLLEEELGVQRFLLTSSCTHALEMAAFLLDVGPGDEVIVPAFTFVSTANAFVVRGATPVFADIDPATLNIDPASVAALLTPRTRAIVVVHYAGVACRMDELEAVVDGRDIPIVEDNAHGLFGSFRGRQLGTFGELATQSFHETKNFSSGEGGGLIVNHARHADRAEILREKGTNRAAFFRGDVDKYTWVDLGSSYLASEFQAAVLLPQLEVRAEIQGMRRQLWEGYVQGLSGWAEDHGVQLPMVPDDCVPAYHLFYLVVPSGEDRDALIAWLRDRGIHAVFHYVPLNTSPYGRRLGGEAGQCPVTERVSDSLLRLPLFPDMTAEQHERVIEAVRSFPVGGGR